MESLEIDLAILLWAVSWNVPELVSDSRVRFMRTSLMKSDELPTILAHWHRPPRTHGTGTRTTAANLTMESWAKETVCKAMDIELRALTLAMSSPQDELTEESLLSIQWQDMIDKVKVKAPTVWYLLRHCAYTPNQEKRNKIKNPDPVRPLIHLYQFLH